MIKKIKFDEELIKIIISVVLFIFSIIFKEVKILHLMLIALSYIVVSYELYIHAIKNILKGEIFDENFLMILATIGAFYIGEYNEAVMVILLFSLGEYLSDLAVDNSKRAITDLMDLRSDFVYLKNGGKVDIKTVKIGEVFVVKPGEKIPLDGIVINGNSNLDIASLTGESIPRHVVENDNVLSGSLNLDSVLEIKATSEYETSTASKIIKLIEESNDKKTNTEKFITRFCKVYTPIVTILAILIVIIPVIMGYELNVWLYRGLQFLVISCPCALVISVPLGFFCGIGRASKEGILIKGSNELDHLTKIKAMVLDKTGTLTKGKFEVSKVCIDTNITEEELLKLLAYAEYFSNHPIAKAIVNKYGKDIDEKKIKDFKEISGNGVYCKIEDAEIYVGNEKLLESIGTKVKVHKNEIGTVVYVARNNEYLGHILITDIIKEEAYTLVEKLDKVGIEEIIMLSGDDIKIASKVGKEVNIKEVYANLLPQDKVSKINEIKDRYFTAFIGDGINDAPVIKLSDIGIAMGGIGSDATIEAADIVLMKDDLNNIPKAIEISKLTKKIIKFNIVFALMLKVIILMLATIGITTIWMAVFADVGVTLICVLNTLQIMKRKV